MAHNLGGGLLVWLWKNLKPLWFFSLVGELLFLTECSYNSIVILKGEQTHKDVSCWWQQQIIFPWNMVCTFEPQFPVSLYFRNVFYLIFERYFQIHLFSFPRRSSLRFGSVWSLFHIYLSNYLCFFVLCHLSFWIFISLSFMFTILEKNSFIMLFYVSVSFLFLWCLYC